MPVERPTHTEADPAPARAVRALVLAGTLAVLGVWAVATIGVARLSSDLEAVDRAQRAEVAGREAARLQEAVRADALAGSPELARHLQRLGEELAALESVPSGPAVATRLMAMKPSFGVYRDASSALAAGADPATAGALLEAEATPTGRELVDLSLALGREREAAQGRVAEGLTDLERTVSLLAGVGVVLLGGMGLVTARRVQRPAERPAVAQGAVGGRLGAAISAAGRSADGVLEAIERLDEPGDAIARAQVLLSDLADETGLLALNATIEAAREGAHGFGRVAQEVKGLAKETTTAAEDLARAVEADSAERRRARDAVRELRAAVETVQALKRAQEGAADVAVDPSAAVARA